MWRGRGGELLGLRDGVRQGRAQRLGREQHQRARAPRQHAEYQVGQRRTHPHLCTTCTLTIAHFSRAIAHILSAKYEIIQKDI